MRGTCRAGTGRQTSASWLQCIWTPCTWVTAATYVGYADEQPMYYDDGDNVGTSEQHYDQAATIASAGAQADAPSDGDWSPLGVFALTKTDSTKSDVSIQLAVNKEGVIRGNSTGTATNKNQVIHGTVDKKTQMVAFTVGDNKENVVETGLYNFTKDEFLVLIHFGKDRTE